MEYHIDAWLEDGKPRLRIYHPRTREVTVSWDYQPTGRNHDQREIQRLFRELILLTCKQEARGVRLFQTSPLVARISDLR